MAGSTMRQASHGPLSRSDEGTFAGRLLDMTVGKGHTTCPRYTRGAAPPDGKSSYPGEPGIMTAWKRGLWGLRPQE